MSVNEPFEVRVKMPNQLAQRLIRAAEKLNISKSELVRQCISYCLNELDKKERNDERLES